jgi:hypothetical protein
MLINSSNNPVGYLLQMSSETSEKPPSQPIPSDYMAAGMIMNGIAWVWIQVLKSGTVLNQIPIRFLTDVTFIVYVLSGVIGAFLVGTKTDSSHLVVGLKATGYGLALNILIMLTDPMPLNLNLLWSMTLSFAAGSVFGSYMALNHSLAAKRKARKAQLKEAKE